MGTEIERKFLVKDDSWRTGDPGTPVVQGYLSRGDGVSVRVRTMGDAAFLTVKGRPVGLSRPEFEYPIPVADARELLALCLQPPLAKTRHRIAHAGLVWEVDEFHGANAPLVTAECELASEDQAVDPPPWVGDEVSGDHRYANSQLAEKPFSTWTS